MVLLSHTLSRTLHRSLLTDCGKCIVLKTWIYHAHQNVFLTFSQSKNASGSSFGPFFTNRNDIFPFIYTVNSEIPTLHIPEAWKKSCTPFGWSLPAQNNIGSTRRRGRFHRNRFSDVEEETLWVGTLLPVPGSYHNGPNDPWKAFAMQPYRLWSTCVDSFFLIKRFILLLVP